MVNVNVDLDKLNKIVDSLTTRELITLKGICEVNLVTRLKITNNFVGDLGVEYALDLYNSRADLPTLHRTATNMKHWDIISLDARTYSVKSLKGKNTSTSPFPGYNGDSTEKYFDAVILVKMNDLYQKEEILEIDFDTFKNFVKYNKWDKTYRLFYTKKLRDASKVIYPA